MSQCDPQIVKRVLEQHREGVEAHARENKLVDWQQATLSNASAACAESGIFGNLPAADKHDAHYREIEAMGVEPMKVMEVIIVAGLPPEFHATARRNLSAALAAKYLLRLGHKDDGNKELDKSTNYVHRARHGEWIPKTEKAQGKP